MASVYRKTSHLCRQIAEAQERDDGSKLGLNEYDIARIKISKIIDSAPGSEAAAIRSEVHAGPAGRFLFWFVPLRN